MDSGREDRESTDRKAGSARLVYRALIDCESGQVARVDVKVNDLGCDEALILVGEKVSAIQREAKLTGLRTHIDYQLYNPA
jgi:hypothetical protein